MKLIESKISKDLIKSYDLDFGYMHFFNAFVVLEINEGVSMNIKKFVQGKKLILKHFNENEPFGLIANRINSYSFDPTDASKLENVFKNLVGLAVVTFTQNSKLTFNFESQFFKIPREKFDTLEEASLWIKKLTNK